MKAKRFRQRTYGALVAAAILLLLPYAYAKPIDADLDVRSVDIDHAFDGMNLLMYGARNDVGRIIIVLRGPNHNYIVRKKERIGGIWVNRDHITFKDISSFYASASTHDLEAIRNDDLLAALNIGPEHLEYDMAQQSKRPVSRKVRKQFKEALVRHKIHNHMYNDDVSTISFMGEILFRSWLEFPRNIVRGWYTAEVYLFNNGQLSAVQSTPIHVGKIGFAAFIFDLAHKHAWLYGILCVLVALLAGWGANKFFSRA